MDKEDFLKAYKFFEKQYNQLPIDSYENFYIYSDLRWFATELGKNLTKDEFCLAIVKPLLDKNKTIIIPTYTYTTEGNFDVLKTSTNLGTLNSWILRQKSINRSEHPLFSFASLGPNSKIVENCGKSAFGENSVHEKLRGKKTCLLHIGKSLVLANTMIHHVEQYCGATYRINKCFKTKVFKNGNYIGTDYNAFLRRRDIPEFDFAFDLTRVCEKVYQTDIPKEIGNVNNSSNITLCDYDKLRSFFVESFLNDPTVFLSNEEKFIQY